MVWAARFIAALAPFYLFFSFYQAHAQGPRCVDVFQIDFDGRYDHMLQVYSSKTKGLSSKEVIRLEMFPRVLNVVRSRLRETHTAFKDLVNEDGQVHAIEILPVGDSALNQTARHLQHKYQAHLRLAVDEPHLASGVTQELNLVTGQYLPIYLVGLQVFLKNKVHPRNFIYRHESRHLGFVEKVVKAVDEDRVIFSAGGIAAFPDSQGFPATSTIALKRDPMETVAPNILAYDEGYRDVLSLEELWNYSRDLQFSTGSLVRTVPKKSFQEIKFQVSAILGDALKLMTLLDRVAQLRTEYEAEHFFTAFTYQDGARARRRIDKKKSLAWTPWIEAQTISFLYAHNIVHGFVVLKSQSEQGGHFLFSLPLAKSSAPLTYEQLQMRMDERSEQISLAATRYRYRLANAYSDLFVKYSRFVGDLPSAETAEVLGQQFYDSLVFLHKTISQESIKFK